MVNSIVVIADDSAFHLASFLAEALEAVVIAVADVLVDVTKESRSCLPLLSTCRWRSSGRPTNKPVNVTPSADFIRHFLSSSPT